MHASDRADLEARERELQTPSCRADPGRLRRLLAEEFTEIGASGRVWGRDDILRALAAEPAESALIEVHDLGVRMIADDVALVRWTSVRGAARALRTSLWRRDSGGWRLVHHQGTPTS